MDFNTNILAVRKNAGDSYFLVGLLSEFSNSFQAKGDSIFSPISWKQCFLLICLEIFDHPPTLTELADTVGCSYQNVKQMLLRLQKNGYVTLCVDAKDRRKQRVALTEKATLFSQQHAFSSEHFMHLLYNGITPQQLSITVETILKMDKNLHDMREF